MREAVIVSYARTGLAKSGRGGFNMTPTMSMGAHAVKHAVERSGLDPAAIEDCIFDYCALLGDSAAAGDSCDAAHPCSDAPTPSPRASPGNCTGCRWWKTGWRTRPTTPPVS